MGALSNLLITVVAFSMIITGFSVMVGEMDDTYDMNTDESAFKDRYSRIDDVADTSKSYSNTMSNSTGFEDASSEGIIKGTWGMLKLGYSSISLPKEIINESTREFGIQTSENESTFGWFGTGITTIIILIITFAVISSVLKRDL